MDPAQAEREARVDDIRTTAPQTGDEAVDAAIARLGDLDDTPVREHVAAFEAVHAALADRLSETRG